MTEHKKRLFGLRTSLERIVQRAKKSNKRGSERTAELQNELIDIKKRIELTLEKIDREEQASTEADAEYRAQAQQAATLEILQAEMVRLAALYHREIDVETIQHFIREQRATIGASMEATARKPSLVSLDTQIGKLHETMAEERARVRQNARKDWLKFWISVTIGAISLSVSIYALSLR